MEFLPVLNGTSPRQTVPSPYFGFSTFFRTSIRVVGVLTRPLLPRSVLGSSGHHPALRTVSPGYDTRGAPCV